MQRFCVGELYTSRTMQWHFYAGADHWGMGMLTPLPLTEIWDGAKYYQTFTLSKNLTIAIWLNAMFKSNKQNKINLDIVFPQGLLQKLGHFLGQRLVLLPKHAQLAPPPSPFSGKSQYPSKNLWVHLRNGQILFKEIQCSKDRLILYEPSKTKVDITNHYQSGISRS